MDRQTYNWTCSVCSFAWTLDASGNPIDRTTAGQLIGYPNCVNETYGCMSSECLVNAYYAEGYIARQAWVTFNEAYAISGEYTGCINPIGMNHYMALRGQSNGDIWVANSAPSYQGVYDILTRDKFNQLGPVQVIYLESYI
jgi:hypothetical protein